MSSSSSSSQVAVSTTPGGKTPSTRRRILMTIGLLIWVFFGFMLAQALVLAAIAGLQALGVSFRSVSETTFNTVGGVIIYALAIVIILGLPWLVKKSRTTKEELGLQRPPRWLDVAWVPLGFLAYLVLTSLVTGLSEHVLTFVDYSQTQETGFSQLASQSEYILAFLSLVIVAPISEEILFRGYLFGKLRKYAPLWLSVVLTSLLFGLVHFQWNVSLDVFALSIVLCLLRVYTKSLWASILLHALKNAIAYYFLFINPSLL